MSESGARTTVATANILYTLGPEQADSALRTVLTVEPDLVGLQEWYPSRLGILRRSGGVRVLPDLGARLGARTDEAATYQWVLPLLGGCVVGARTERYELRSCHLRRLSAPGRGEREDRFLGLEPPRFATVAVYRDRQLDRTVALVDFHLVSGVQRHGAYRSDRPVLSERHRREVRRLEEIVARLLDQGHVVHAVGDSNFDGMRLSGLTSAWTGREDAPGTLGRTRHVDDVHGPGRAELVTTLSTESDHKAVVVRRTVPRAAPAGDRKTAR